MTRFNDASYDLIANCIITNGYAIVENVIDQEKLNEIRSDLADRIQHVSPDTTSNKFMGSKTVRFGRLMYENPSTHSIAQHALTMNILDRVLLKVSPKYKLSFTGAMHLTEGQHSQVLHRDNVPFWNPAPIVLVATMWAINDFTKRNGATVFAPGSHLWDDKRVPTKTELMCAEMPAGSVLFYAGNLLHGAGNCTNGVRTGLSLQYNVSWLAHDEFQFASNERELQIARTLPDDLLELMGYSTVARNWGTMNDMHPIDFLKTGIQLRSLDESGSEFENGSVHELRLETKLSTGKMDLRYEVDI